MDDTRLLRIRRRHGLITTRAASDAGFDPREIARFVRSGRWVTVRRGVFIEAEIWAAADRWSDRPRLASRAADLTLNRPHIFSHDSAALEHGIPLIGVPTFVHITRRGIGGSRRHGGIVQRGAAYDAARIECIDGLRVLPLERTAIDIAREHGYAAGLVAMDGALRLGADLTELRSIRDAMTRWPGISAADAALTDVDPGAETAGETLTRILLRSLGLGKVRTQFPVRCTDGSTAWLDMLIGCQGVEFDGHLKFLGPGEGGTARKSADQIAWDEKKRERLIRPLGLGISRVIWEDVTVDPTSAGQRLREEFRQTAAQFGVRPSASVEAYAARMEPHRQRRLRSLRKVRRLD